VAVKFSKGRGDGKLMTGLAPSKTPVRLPPLLPRVMKGMTGKLVEKPLSALCTNNSLTMHTITICYFRSRCQSWAK